MIVVRFQTLGPISPPTLIRRAPQSLADRQPAGQSHLPGVVSDPVG
jgi:hypothetical protein